MQSGLESLFVLGTSHHATPLDIRERFALTVDQTNDLQAQIHAQKGVRECLVLNTCNRLEIYCSVTSSSSLGMVRALLCKAQGISELLFEQHAYNYTNLDALQHLLEVSSGLDSQMIGETEILGQLKQSFASARKDQCTGKIFNRLFEKSFQAAKAVRSKTNISRGQISIGNVTVNLASRIFGQLNRSRVLLIGSGEVGEKTALALKSRGVDDISVSSRTLENAQKLANSLGCATINFEDCTSHLEYFDIIICSAASPKIILNKTALRSAMNQRPERPCFLIDLALPRNIDPAVDSLENTYLYNLDDLSSIANENLCARKNEIHKAREILKKHAWSIWLQVRRREQILSAGDS